MINLKSLITETNEFFNAKLVKAVENWIFKNDKKYINTIASYKKIIPQPFKTGGNYYRAMVLPQTIIDDLTNGKSLLLKNYSSWTDTEQRASKFLTDKSKSTTKNKGVKIIFKKKLTTKDTILNIQAYITYMYSSSMLDNYDFDELTTEMGMEEGEIIADKGITLTNKNIHKTLN